MKNIVIGGLVLAFFEVLIFIVIGIIAGPEHMKTTLKILLAGCITAALAILLMIIDMIWKNIHSKK